MYDKNNRELRGRVGASINKILDAAKCDGNRGLTSDELTKFHALEVDYTKLDARIQANEDGFNHNPPIAMGPEQMRDEFRASPRQQRERHFTAHGAAFDTFLRRGPPGGASV